MFVITVSILWRLKLMPIPKHFKLAWKVDAANNYFVRYHGTVLSREVVVSYAYKKVKQVALPKQGRRPKTTYRRWKRNQQTQEMQKHRGSQKIAERGRRKKKNGRRELQVRKVV
jgi:hypothetical protein